MSDRATASLDGLAEQPGVPKPDPILTVSNVSRSFGGLKAVDVEHLEIQRGMITALIGPNGAGKTTFFNLMTGFDQADTGERVFNGERLSRRAGSAPARRAVASAGVVTVALLGGLVVGGAVGQGNVRLGQILGFVVGLTLLFFGNRMVLTNPPGPRSNVFLDGRAARPLYGIAGLATGLVVSEIAVWATHLDGRWSTLLPFFDTVSSGILGFALGSYVQGPYSPHELAQHGMVRTFQLTKSLTKLPVIQNMALGAKGQVGERLSRGLIHPLWTDQEASIEQRADELLKRFKLDHMRNEFAGTLSGGQRKLLEMARALMTDPTLVMLDEPMAGVNPALTQSLLEHIQGLRDDGLTVVFVEHDMDVVSEISDWVVVMAEGRIIAEGPPAAIGRNQQVIDAYLGSDHESNLVRTVDGTGTGDAPTGDVTTSDVTDDATGKGSDGASNSDGGV